MRRMTAAGLLAGVLFIAFVPLAAAQGPPKPVTVPFTLLPSRHIVVSAMVNGKGPYKFIFDTGAPLNLVSNAVAKEAGLTKGGGGGGLAMLLAGPAQVQIKTLTLGDAAAEKVPAIVMDHPTVGVISDVFKDEVGTISGIIGFPYFARYAMTVDYQKKQLTLTPSGFKPGNFLDDIFGRLDAMSKTSNTPRVLAPAGLWGLTVKKSKDDTESGVIVDTISADGPAAKAGLQAGDRMLTIDGRWTDTIADAYLATGHVKPGRAVAVSILRGGKELKLTVTPTNGL